jgi:hypothetical protein
VNGKELPSFIKYSDGSRTLMFLPSNKKTQGRSYDFALALGDETGCEPPTLFSLNL